MKFYDKLCPFCKKDNNCNILKPNSCWCMKEKIPDELKNLVPLSEKKSCICQNCVLKYKADRQSFIKKNK